MLTALCVARGGTLYLRALTTLYFSETHRKYNAMADGPAFAEAEYVSPPCTGLETQDPDGSWHRATAWTHATRGNVVLFYGSDTYEGLGEGYRWEGVWRPGAPDNGPAPRLLDGDGDDVPTRWARRGGPRVVRRPRAAGSAVHMAAQAGHRFLPFDKALAVVQSLGLATSNEWKEWCKEGVRPPDIPCHPDRIYKDSGWQGWGHWLGTGEFLPLEEALAVARSRGGGGAGGGEGEGEGGAAAPGGGPPARPHGNTKNFLSFAEARVLARGLRLCSQLEWRACSKAGLRPRNVPAHPDRIYKHSGWRGWGYWLGYGPTA